MAITPNPAGGGSNSGSNSNSSGGPSPITPNSGGPTPNSGSGPTPLTPSGAPSPITIRPAGSGPVPSSGGGGGGGGGGAGGGFNRAPAGPRFPRREFQQSKDEHRINERIRVPQVRLIDHIGAQIGVVPTTQALMMAREVSLDLVEISPNSSPPVCKILDYGKFKYEKKKKDHEAKKKQVVVKVKEVQLRPNTDDHDLDYKFRNIRTFLEEGDKAKITIMFRGREVAYVDNGYKIMRQLVEDLKDIGVVESPAKLEGKKLIMILAPNPLAKKTAKKEKVEKAAKPERAEKPAASDASEPSEPSDAPDASSAADDASEESASS